MSLSIDSYAQYFTAGKASAQDMQAKILEDKLKNKTATDEELMDVCKSFEAYFLEQVMKGMEKTIPSEEKKNAYLDYFGDMFYQEVAKNATENQGLGLAQILYEAIKKNG